MPQDGEKSQACPNGFVQTFEIVPPEVEDDVTTGARPDANVEDPHVTRQHHQQRPDAIRCFAECVDHERRQEEQDY